MRTVAEWKRLFVILLLFGAVRAFGGDPLDGAVQRLSTARVFAVGGVGFAGKTSKGETDLRFLIS